MKPSRLSRLLSYSVPNPALRKNCIVAFILFSSLTASVLRSQQSAIANYDADFFALYKSGEYLNALPYALKSLELRRSTFGDNHTHTSTGLNNVGILYKRLDRLEEAEPYYLEALRISEVIDGPYDPSTATSLNNLASLYKAQGHYAEAEPLYSRALEIRKTSLGENHNDTAQSYSNVALIQRELGRFLEAEEGFKKSIQIREGVLGSDHEDLSESLFNLGMLFLDLERLDEAQPILIRANEISRVKNGSKHPITGIFAGNLGRLYQEQGELALAELQFDTSINILTDSLGSAHSATTNAMMRKASLLLEKKEYREADDLTRDIILILEEGGADHRSLAGAFEIAALIAFDQGISEDAEKFASRALEYEWTTWKNVLQYFSERELLLFQQSREPSALSATIGSGRLSAKTQVRFKGIVMEAIQKRKALEARLLESEAGRSILSSRDLWSKRYQRALLEMGSNAPEALEIASQLDQLEKQAASITNLGRPEGSDVEVTLDKVRAKLPPGTALVESFRYSHLDGEKDSDKRYSSVLITSSENSTFIEHGNASTLDQAIVDFRKLLLESSRSVSSEEELLFRDLEAELYELLLAPIESHLSAGQLVMFCPDAQMHFIPLGVLRDRSGVRFGEKFNVRYVSSSRDFLRSGQGVDTTNLSAAVLGNPAFRDNSPLLALSGSEESDSAGSLVRNSVLAGADSRQLSLGFGPLPGSEKEARIVSGQLTEAGYSVTRLIGEEATEKSLPESVRGRRIVHLATHGFFLPEGDGDGSRYPGEERRDKDGSKVARNSMYRSGLALCGAQTSANLWREGKIPPTDSDGILTAAEFSLLELDGVELVTLSACDTALGVSLDGEGILGLRRAAAAAGASNLIMTLWPVNDESTVEVMTQLYQRFLGGASPPEALADVQSDLFGSFTDKYGEVEAMKRLAPFVCIQFDPAD